MKIIGPHINQPYSNKLRGIEKVNTEADDPLNASNWIAEAEQFRALSLLVVDQPQRHVYLDESVLPSEKIIGLFELHTDIIAKNHRGVQYEHKINLSTQADGFVTNVPICGICTLTYKLVRLMRCSLP